MEVNIFLFADANFGIFKDRDEEITDYVVELKEKIGQPKMFSHHGLKILINQY